MFISLAHNGLRLKKVGDFEVQTFFWKPHFKCKTNFHKKHNEANLFLAAVSSWCRIMIYNGIAH
jgi:hypothetical protein